MEFALKLIDRGDFCSLTLVVVILWLLGAYLVQGQPAAQSWGTLAALLVFIAYGIYRLVGLLEPDAAALLAIVLRGLLAAGLTLGVAWVIAPLMVIAYRHHEQHAQAVQAWARQRQAERQRRHKELQDEQRRQREQQQWERQAPERERSASEAEQRRRALEEDQRRIAQAEAQAQRRRDDARFTCQLFYDRLTSDQKQQFPRERLDAYIAQYLSDGHTPEYVETRAEQLQSMIRETFQAVDTKPAFASLHEIAAHFQERRQEIERLDYDQKIKDVFVALITQAEQTAIRRFFSP